MLRCSPEAFAKCPTRHICGKIEEATFAEGSECDRFNQSVATAPMTNGDWIRSMSDEDLATFIGTNSLCDRIQREGDWCDKHAVCRNCLTKWLQQPVGEVHG